MAFKEEGSVRYEIIDGKKVPIVECEAEIVTRSVKIKVAAMPPLGAASDE
jgi:hypothetical protein